MIDSNGLRELGWSDELISIAELVSKQLQDELISVPATVVQFPILTTTEVKTTIDFPTENPDQFSWPKF